MTKVRSILAIDVGAKRCGWAFYNGGELHQKNSFATESFRNFYNVVKNLIEGWQPTLVVCGKPNRMYNVIACQEKYIGICCLLAEGAMLPLVEINDSTVRAKLFPGKGKAAKEEIQKLIGIEDPDACDAAILAKGAYIMGLGED